MLHTGRMEAEATPALAVSSRLPLRPPPYEPEVAAAVGSNAFKGLSPLNLRLALANHRGLGPAFQAMAHVVLFQCAVPERDREIAIIRTGALNRSEYEWGMHVSIYAQRCGLDAAQVHDLSCAADWHALAPGLWTEPERLIVRMADELHRHSTVSDATWDGLNAHWPQQQVVELLFASAFYTMAAFFLNSAAVPLEHGSERFPAGLAQAEVPA